MILLKSLYLFASLFLILPVSIESVKQNDEEPKAKVLKRELKKEIKKEISIGNGMKLKLPKNKLSGEGGYSSVMKGELQLPNEPWIEVAVKFQYGESEELRQEYEIYGKLNATLEKGSKDCEKFGIPFVYYFGAFAEHYHILVMTYADRSLTDELLKVQPKHDLDLNTQVLTFINALKSLAYIHDKGIYHRDVKPDNLLVRDEDGQLFLIDFNLAADKNIKQTGPSMNLLFCSEDSHYFEENTDKCNQTDVDDLESLAYTMGFITGYMNGCGWYRAFKENNKYQVEVIKQRRSPFKWLIDALEKVLGNDYSKAFLEFYVNVRKLQILRRKAQEDDERKKPMNYLEVSFGYKDTSKAKQEIERFDYEYHIELFEGCLDKGTPDHPKVPNYQWLEKSKSSHSFADLKGAFKKLNKLSCTKNNDND